MDTPIALVTGASARTRPGAGHRPRPAAAGGSSSTPATPPGSPPPSPRSPDPSWSPPSPATSPTRPTAGALAAAVGEPARPAGQQRHRRSARARCPRLADLPPAELERILAVNTVAPLALTQLLLPALRAARGTVVDVSSDAAVEAYEGWGGYGASKAALDQLTAVLAVEDPELRVYAVDPGDMATDMHQAAFPGEDISDRPAPETVVPGAARAGRRRPAQRPLPRRRPRSDGGRPMTTSRSPPTPRRPRRPSGGASSATRCG